MRTLIASVLVGLFSLTDVSIAAPATETIARHYHDTWYASDAEKDRCTNLLRRLSGDDLQAALKNGISIDEDMRKAHCLDIYSYVYGQSMLPFARNGAKLDAPSVDRVGSYLFVYINTFETTDTEITQKISTLQRKDIDAVKTVVLDVRGNSGGYISALHALLDLSFAPKPGMKYLELAGHATFGTFYTTTRTGLFAGREIRILADEDTASSSEWMIETLCYEWYPDRCTTVGKKTTGKSVLQCITQLPGIEVKITCGEWYLPKRGDHTKDPVRLPQRVQGVGIPPDKPMAFDCDRFAYECIAHTLADAGL